MKIGIISPYKSQNYGTVLQAYALAYVLKKQGVECEYINYSPWKRGSKIRYLFFIIKHPRYIISSYRTGRINRNDLKYDHIRDSWFSEVVKKNTLFVEKNIPYSSQTYTYDTIKNLRNEYSKFIIGSDQTWSPFHELHYSCFFLDYDKYGKLYSYAPSLGTITPNTRFLKFLSKKIHKMRLASCRELSNSELLSNTCGMTVECVLDPTLLLSRSEWQNLFEFLPDIPSEYILCYILGERNEISCFAEKLGKDRNLPVLYITTREMYRTKRSRIDNVGVANFLYLVNNAKYIVTDSFHCTIFAINFNRDFYCFDKMPGYSYDNGRLADVLGQVGLMSRLNVGLDEDVSSIDYTTVNELLEERRRSSLSFINKIIAD